MWNHLWSYLNWEIFDGNYAHMKFCNNARLAAHQRSRFWRFIEESSELVYNWKQKLIMIQQQLFHTHRKHETLVISKKQNIRHLQTRTKHKKKKEKYLAYGWSLESWNLESPGCCSKYFFTINSIFGDEKMWWCYLFFKFISRAENANFTYSLDEANKKISKKLHNFFEFTGFTSKFNDL